MAARAGDVKVSFDNGLVTVVATDASPRQILGEWARLGQVRVTNIERLSGVPVTLQLTGVPEVRALDVILRGTAGYVAAPRRVPAAALSEYDRILLLPGTAPVVRAATASPGAAPSTAADRGGFGAPPYMQPAADRPFGRPGFMQPGMPGQGSPSFALPRPTAGDEEEAQPGMPTPPSAAVPGVQAGGTQNTAASPLGAARPGEVVGPDILSNRAKYGPGVQVPTTSGQGVTPYGLPNPTVPAPGQPSSGPIKVPEQE
jgi:hypothetical protein